MTTPLKIATANIAGGARQEAADPNKFEALSELLCNGDVDITGVQEVVKVYDSYGRVIRDDIEKLTGSTGCKGFFFCILDSTIYSHPGKWGSPIFKPYFDKGCRILQGAAIVLREDHSFADFFGNGRPGGCPVVSQVIPWYAKEEGPVFYQGNRNTEPRSLLLARIKIKELHVLFGATQLSTLTGERSSPPEEAMRKKAVQLRKEQLEWICRYMDSCRQAAQAFPGADSDATFLVGDFNAEEDELDAHLDRWDVKRIPVSDGAAATHRKHGVIIDHICASMEGKAKIMDLGRLEKDKGKRISDHNPVFAEFEFR